MRNIYEQEKIEERRRKILFGWIIPITVSIAVSTLTVLTVLYFK